MIVSLFNEYEAMNSMGAAIAAEIERLMRPVFVRHMERHPGREIESIAHSAVSAVAAELVLKKGMTLRNRKRNTEVIRSHDTNDHPAA